MENDCRLIDANALKERAINMVTVNSLGNKQHCYFKAVGTDEIDKAPTVDAVEVVHARWVRYEHGSGIFCSHCRRKRRYKDEHDNYCPNCGAKMDGGNEDV